jgi:hypothetical protein
MVAVLEGKVQIQGINTCAGIKVVVYTAYYFWIYATVVANYKGILNHE